LKGGKIKIKGDRRILGNSNFVEMVLKPTDEQLESRYRLTAEGFDLEQVAERVAQVLDIPKKLSGKRAGVRRWSMCAVCSTFGPQNNWK
jgi:hypothetical protein